MDWLRGLFGWSESTADYNDPLQLPVTDRSGEWNNLVVREFTHLCQLYFRRPPTYVTDLLVSFTMVAMLKKQGPVSDNNMVRIWWVSVFHPVVRYFRFPPEALKETAHGDFYVVTNASFRVCMERILQAFTATNKPLDPLDNDFPWNERYDAEEEEEEEEEGEEEEVEDMEGEEETTDTIATSKSD